VYKQLCRFDAKVDVGVSWSPFRVSFSTESVLRVTKFVPLIFVAKFLVVEFSFGHPIVLKIFINVA